MEIGNRGHDSLRVHARYRMDSHAAPGAVPGVVMGNSLRLVCVLVALVVCGEFMMALTAIPVFSGIASVRIDSRDVKGDPIAFQLSIDGKLIEPKIALDPKPWIYEAKFDSRLIPDGLHVMAGTLWYTGGKTVQIDKQIIRIRQPVGKLARI